MELGASVGVQVLAMRKWVCEQGCGAHVREDELLVAANPFDDRYQIVGCPTCRMVETLVEACEASDCWRPTSAGYPMKDGTYRRACSEHSRQDREAGLVA